MTLVSTFARPDARLLAILDAWRVIYPKLGPADFARQSWPWLFSWRFFERPANPRTLQRYAENAPRPQEPAAFVRQAEASHSRDRRADLAGLRVPTLVIAGAEDALVPPYLGRELAEAIPGAEFVVLPDVGHSANLEGRAAFNRLLGEFLAQH
ncbi:MAG: alpha/beta fold hydrolase [Thermomicrobiales bacterium]